MANLLSVIRKRLNDDEGIFQRGRLSIPKAPIPSMTGALKSVIQPNLKGVVDSVQSVIKPQLNSLEEGIQINEGLRDQGMSPLLFPQTKENYQKTKELIDNFTIGDIPVGKGYNKVTEFFNPPPSEDAFAGIEKVRTGQPINNQERAAIREHASNEALNIVGMNEGLKSASKPVLNKIDDFVSVVAREYRKRGGESVEQPMSNVLKTVQQKFDIADEVLDQIDRGFGGENFSITRRDGNLLEIIFDDGFKPNKIKTESPVIRASKTKQPKIKVSKTTGDFTPISPKTGQPIEMRQAGDSYTPLKISRNSVRVNPPKVSKKVGEYTPIDTRSGAPFDIRETQGGFTPMKPTVVKDAGESTPLTFEKTIEILEDKDNNDLIRATQRAADDMDQALQAMRNANLADKGIVDKAYDDMMKSIGDATGVTKMIDSLKKTIRNFSKFNYTDQDLDQQAKNLLVNQWQLIDKPWNDFLRAKAEAAQLIGRKLTGDELGAVLRREVDRASELSEKGVTDRKIGADVQDKADALYEIFRPVHEDVGALVILQQRKLDALLVDGVISRELYNKLKPVDAQTFIKNLDKYLRTSYSKKNWQYDVMKFYEPALNEVYVNNSTQYKKLTDLEWGQAYIKALKEHKPEEVSRNLHIPQELVDRVSAGEEGAVKELGRMVKELRGYIYEGDVALRNTINYFARNIHDISLLDYVARNPNIASPEYKAGFTIKGEGVLSNFYLRDDVGRELVEDLKHQKELIDEGISILKQFAGAWKFAQVPARPASWVRNWLSATVVQQSNGGNSIANPLNVPYYVRGYKEFFEGLVNPLKQSKDFRDFIDNAGFSANYADTEIIDFFTGKLKEIGEKPTASQMQSIFNDLVIKYGDASEKTARAYGYLDGLQKYVMYLNKIDHGYTPQEAVLIAHKYLNNYAIIPKFLRQIRDNPIGSIVFPFLSFTASNTPVWIETLIKRPWRYFIPLATIVAYNTMWKATHPDHAREVEVRRPHYLRDNPYTLIAGYDSERDEYMYVDMGLLLGQPLRTSPSETLREFAFQTASPFILSGGALDTLRTLYTGKDAFGREIGGAYGPSKIDVIARLFPYVSILQSMGEIADAAMGVPYSDAGNIRTVGDAVLRMFGVNVNRAGYDQLSKNIDQITYELEKRIEGYERALQNPNLSDAEREKALTEIEKETMRARAEIDVLIAEADGSTPTPITGDITDQTMPSITPNLPDFKNVGNPLLEKVMAQSGKGKKIKVKAPPKIKIANIKVPRGKKIKALSSYIDDEIVPPKLRPLRVSTRKKPTIKLPKKPPAVRGLRVG